MITLSWNQFCESCGVELRVGIPCFGSDTFVLSFYLVTCRCGKVIKVPAINLSSLGLIPTAEMGASPKVVTGDYYESAMSKIS